MARKKRTVVAEAASLPAENLWQAGIYVRLSVLYNGKTEGESLESQIKYLEQYVAEHSELCCAGLYQDNGFTGTNFARPDWERLLTDISLGKINCIVVKDLSRLGRNYIEVGSFLERDCQRLGIRLISVNDGYDSSSLNATEELSAALKNIFNDYYAKDISRKVCSAMSVKRRRGDYVGSYAPYGYQKDPENKNRLIVDPDAAEVVRRIFKLRAAGMGYGSILRLLNAEGIPCPGRYRYEQGIITNNNKKGPEMLWARHVLTDILADPVYLGHLAQGKCRASLYEGIAAHTVDKSEWDVVLNTHEPIIDEELFQQVQNVRSQKKKSYDQNYGRYAELPHEENPYRKHLVCADCGRQLKLIRQYAHEGKKVYHSYVCPSYVEAGLQACTKKSMRSFQLDETVLAMLSGQMELFLDCEAALAALVKSQLSPSAKASLKMLHSLERELERKVSLSASCYTDWKDGLLTEEEYRYMKEKYQADAESLRIKVDELKASCCQLTDRTADRMEYWKARIEAFQPVSAVSPELIEAFVQKICLHEDGSLDIAFAFEADFSTFRSELERIRKEAIAV